MDEMFAVGWRIWAWLKLVKVWVQAILPGVLRMIEGRLTTIL